jgi:hypothetical protein
MALCSVSLTDPLESSKGRDAGILRKYCATKPRKVDGYACK